jgi:hypothetical protein
MTDLDADAGRRDDPTRRGQRRPQFNGARVMDICVLIGADDVRAGGNAAREGGREMQSAAGSMQHAAEMMQRAFTEQQMFLNDWLERFEATLNAKR